MMAAGAACSLALELLVLERAAGGGGGHGRDSAPASQPTVVSWAQPLERMDWRGFLADVTCWATP